MVIKELQINNFGNLKNKKIELDKGINVIFGENESGKSTLLKFITSIFYGASKNKSGKKISDFEKYTPWNDGEFSGKIKYVLDNRDEYEVYRNFAKKSPQILDSNGKDITKKYTIDKTNGNKFFFEQTKVDEELFNTVMTVEQQEVKLDEKKQNSLIQKLSNIMLTGEDDVSYKKIINKLIKRQNDEIGTDKSPTKPLYIIREKIKELKNKKIELQNIMPVQYEMDEERKNIEKEISDEANELELLQEIQKFQNDIKLEYETININLRSKKELENKKDDEKENLNNLKTRKPNKKTHKKIYIIPLLLTIIAILFLIFDKVLFFQIALSFGLIMLFITIALNIYENKKYKKIKDEEKSEINSISNKIEIIENEIREKENIIKQKQNEIEIKKNSNIQYLLNKYKNMSNIERIINKEIDDESILNKQKSLNEVKLELTKLEMKKNEIIHQTENAIRIEEELENYEEQLKELLEYNDAINLAQETLEKAYTSMRENITPKFSENLSNTIKKISGEKYKTVKVSEENGILIETENGKYVPADVLSTGTIDQLFLSLRISSLNELTKEKMPIILDETFAYFDKRRLENVLKFLNQEYKDSQILILTCTNREMDILEELNIKYNKIAL